MPPAIDATWVSDYVGLPFKEHGRDRAGVDCWGLVRLVLAERFGLDLPSFATSYEGIADQVAIADAIRAERPGWLEILVGRETPGCVVLLRMCGLGTHVGLVVAPARMLHIERGLGAAVEDYYGLRWRRRLLGFFRHRDMAAP